jgi:SAM-dependent methyltransferase
VAQEFGKSSRPTNNTDGSTNLLSLLSLLFISLRATEMAREFPHCDVVGVDLAPVPIKEGLLPQNCHFEIDDINCGLDHFHNQFDLVHARLIGAGIHNFRKTVHDAVQCLKPGGMIVWSEPDYDFYCAEAVASALRQRENVGEANASGSVDRTGMMWSRIGSETYPNGTWFGRIIWGAFTYLIVSIGFLFTRYPLFIPLSPPVEMKRSSINLRGSDMIEMAKTIDEGLWNDELIDPATYVALSTKKNQFHLCCFLCSCN